MAPCYAHTWRRLRTRTENCLSAIAASAASSASTSFSLFLATAGEFALFRAGTVRGLRPVVAAGRRRAAAYDHWWRGVGRGEPTSLEAAALVLQYAALL